MKVINLYGGPGSGKSTLAANLFGYMKSRDYNVELVTEYAKDKVYENNLNVLNNQVYIFAKQYQRLFRLENNNVEYVILDSPLLLSIIYNKINGGKFQNLDPLVYETYSKYQNIDFFLLRNHNYQQNGRIQNENEAKDIDFNILDMIRNYGLELNMINFDSKPADLLNIILRIE